MRIRTARDDDWAACLALDLAYETDSAWQMEEVRTEKVYGVQFREVRLPRQQTVTPTFMLESRVQAWERCDVFWVAVEQRVVVGYLGLTVAWDRIQARIVDLGVAATHRRQGIATALLQHATEWAFRHQLPYLMLACSLKAQPAIKLAMNQHFSFCGFQDAYWSEQTTALFFCKRIR